jgi:histidinol-phosphate aminotransferase
MTGGRVPPPRPWISGLDPYVPGRPAADEARSMASNESSFGASPAVAAAVAWAVKRIHRYPDPLAGKVRGRLAERLEVPPEQVLVGNGSDELIQLLALAYASAGGSVVCADPPYRLHELVPRALGASVHRVPLKQWTHDLSAMARVPADLALICNPHNPTGTVVPRTEIAEFALGGSAGLVVVDEAYVDFVDDEDEVGALPLARASDVVILRTFSKVHGLAGARVGYLVGPAAVVEILTRVRLPFSVNAIAQAAAVVALDHPEHAAAAREHARGMRVRLRRLFEDAGYGTIPSQTNFVLVLSPDEDGLVRRLERAGVRVRPGSTLGAPGTVRVTVPSEEGFALLNRALAESPV